VLGDSKSAQPGDIGDDHVGRQPILHRVVDARRRKLDPLERVSVIANELGILRGVGAVVDYQDFAVLEGFAELGRLARGYQARLGNFLDGVDQVFRRFGGFMIIDRLHRRSPLFKRRETVSLHPRFVQFAAARTCFAPRATTSPALLLRTSVIFKLPGIAAGLTC
jgi:hypothetical protein